MNFDDYQNGLRAGQLGPDERTDNCPEKSLMSAVVISAVAEALGHRPVGIHVQAARDEAKTRARQWILSEGSGFEDACDLAGLDAHWIRRRLRKFMAMGRQSNVLDKRPRQNCDDDHKRNGTNTAPSLIH